MNSRNRIETDVVVIGGGIAGLWLLNVLTARGFDAVLLERDALGAGQTLASQGMIHGGLKYALAGTLTGASEAIADMPRRWRDCLAGDGDVDLTGVPVLSDRYYMWANETTLSQLGAFLASKLLRGRIQKLTPEAYPEPFRHGFVGSLYELDDLVLDTGALVSRLATPHKGRIVHAHVTAEMLRRDASGDIEAIVTADATIGAGTFVFAAGAGNGELLAACNSSMSMQLRPLHQVLIEHSALPPLFAHCISDLKRPEPRITITSHQRGGQRIWYVGGQLASSGVDRSDTQQHAVAASELEHCLPWLDLADARMRSVRVDRAEPRTISGLRPDEAFVARHGRVITVWPTKLSLAPDLGDKVLACLDAPLQGVTDHGFESPIAVALAPWQ